MPEETVFKLLRLRQQIHRLIEAGKAREGGMAMVLALITLALGSLMIVPTLNHMITGLQSTIIQERRTGELYAADAGVEYAVWKLNSDNLTLSEGQQTNLTQLQLNNSMVNTTVLRIPGAALPTYQVTSTANSTYSSNTTIESYIYVGNLLFTYGLASEGDIDVGKDCTVNGDIYYGGTFNYGQDFTHNGEVRNGGLDFPLATENAEFAQKYKDEAILGGTYVGNYVIPNGPATVDLGPLYITGALQVRKDNVVNLTGTIYVEGSIDVDKDAEFTGTGSILAVGDIYLAKMSDYGTDGASVIMSLTGDITFKKEANIEALIYAPDGTVRFDKDAEVTGSVVAADIQVDKDSTFTFDNGIGDLDLPGGGLHIQSWKIN